MTAVEEPTVRRVVKAAHLYAFIATVLLARQLLVQYNTANLFTGDA
jgi:hypothetical protein